MTSLQIARFWARVKMTEGCWEWEGPRHDSGYGALTVDGNRNARAHRTAWRILNGATELCVLHRCDNRLCVRPDHLFLGTRGNNARDMAAKGRHRNQRKTHCPHGHPLIGKNLYVTKDNRRQCYTCAKLSSTNAKAKKEREKSTWQNQR